jgi:hypothetical protein
MFKIAPFVFLVKIQQPMNLKDCHADVPQGSSQSATGTEDTGSNPAKV